MNKFPLRLSPGLPIFAEDLEQVIESWQLLQDQGVKTIYPAHGKPFSANKLYLQQAFNQAKCPANFLFAEFRKTA